MTDNALFLLITCSKHERWLSELRELTKLDNSSLRSAIVALERRDFLTSRKVFSVNHYQTTDAGHAYLLSLYDRVVEWAEDYAT